MFNEKSKSAQQNNINVRCTLSTPEMNSENATHNMCLAEHMLWKV